MILGQCVDCTQGLKRVLEVGGTSQVMGNYPHYNGGWVF